MISYINLKNYLKISLFAKSVKFACGNQDIPINSKV